MAHLVKLDADHIELPHLSLNYPISRPLANLEDGLEAFQTLREDLSLQSLPLQRRREVTRFLRQLGMRLFESVFPQDSYRRLQAPGPLLLQIAPALQAYPWELLNDGENWLALTRGLVRYVARPATPPAPAPGAPGPLRVLALSADPLTPEGESPISAHKARLGTRFISSVDMLLAPSESSPPKYLFRAVEHAGPHALESGLDLSPGLVYFSGFTTAEGWVLEGDDSRPERLGGDWLAKRLGQAARQGLRGLVLNDSLGMLDPAAAAAQAESAFQAGLPALIRIQGRQARLREQDYLRTLVNGLCRGAPLAACHLAAVRRLHRRFEESWDWSFVQLFHRAAPQEGETPISHQLPDTNAYAVRREESPDLQRGEAGFALMPPPPLFRRKRRVFGRQRELERLAGALRPDESAGSPLVCLSGAPGSGKTALALEAARRMHRHFMQVVYLHGRDLLPESGEPARPSPLEPQPPSPTAALFGSLARHLEARGITAGPEQQWGEALGGYLAMGPPRLIVVDGLEHHPGYYEFCRGLQTFPLNCRVLLISRAKPPLLPGPHFHLEPLGPAELEGIFHPSLLQRIAAHPEREALLQVCGTDLLVARMLWRLQRWPARTRLGPLLADRPGDDPRPAGRDTGALLELVLQAVLAELSRDALNVLQALGMFTFLVHQEVLSHLTELDGGRLGQALAELQWMGLVDAYDGERYFGLHLRLQNQIAARQVTPVVYRRLLPLLARSTQGWLAELGGGTDAAGMPPGGAGFPLLAWGEQNGRPGNIALTRRCHRIGLERINLCELALMLAEEQDWQGLTRLVAAAAFFKDMPGMEDMARLLDRLMLAAAVALEDANLQAGALVGLARPLLAADRPEQAQPLLEHALRLLGSNPAWEQLAETYLLLSGCYEALGRAEAAINMLCAAEELAGQLGNAHYLVEAAGALVRIWREQGESEAQAESFLERTIQRIQQGGHHLHAAKLKVLLGESLSRTGRGVEAQELFQAALNTIRDAEVSQDGYDTLLRLAQAYLLENLPDEALDAFMQARIILIAGKDQARESRALEPICRMFEGDQRYQEALNGYLLLRTIREEIGGREGLLAVLDIIGGLYFQLGEQAKSTRFYQESLQLKESIAQA